MRSPDCIQAEKLEAKSTSAYPKPPEVCNMLPAVIAGRTKTAAGRNI
jgi:hypothetical protein